MGKVRIVCYIDFTAKEMSSWKAEWTLADNFGKDCTYIDRNRSAFFFFSTKDVFVLNNNEDKFIFANWINLIRHSCKYVKRCEYGELNWKMFVKSLKSWS